MMRYEGIIRYMRCDLKAVRNRLFRFHTYDGIEVAPNPLDIAFFQLALYIPYGCALRSGKMYHVAMSKATQGCQFFIQIHLQDLLCFYFNTK